MRLDKNTDTYLYDILEIRKAFRCRTKAQQQEMFYEMYAYAAKHEYEAFRREYVGGTGSTEEQAKEAYFAFFRDIFYHQIVSEKVTVDYVCDSFAQQAIMNQSKLLECFGDAPLCDYVKNESGYLLYGKWNMLYIVTEDRVAVELQERNGTTVFKEKVWYNQSANILHKIVQESGPEVVDAVLLGLTILLFKNCGEIETVHVGSGVRRVIPNNDDSVVVNKMPFQINVIDSSWLRTIVRAEGFSVRGHFRLQPCGVGRCGRRLIYIKPFQKHGYVRTARKVVHERNAINS